MAAWHRSRRADLGLRALGLLLCCLSAVALGRLAAMHVPPQSAGAVAYGLAAAGAVAASGGGAMLFLGRHLFDEIELSARWHPRARERAAAGHHVVADPVTTLSGERAA
jgi:hypothetical protein